MWWYILAGSIVLVPSILIAKKNMRDVVYETQLVVQNEEGEFLLVYDKEAKRFNAPVQKVPFDEIPTKMVYIMMEKILPGATFVYDSSFHSTDNKYDRIRDDVGPAYVYEVKRQFRKQFRLCYVLKMDSYEMSERLKKEAPYPEFYSLDDIENMSKDICPQKMMLDVFKNIASIKETEYAFD